MYPSFINPDTGIWTGFKKSLGAHCDSYYEYLLKVWKIFCLRYSKLLIYQILIIIKI